MVIAGSELADGGRVAEEYGEKSCGERVSALPFRP
jgi:hypothetical protein